MKGLVQAFRDFNAKERFWLWSNVFCDLTPDLPRGLTLTARFRQTLEGYGFSPVPESSFAAMDYHFDWIVGALHWASGTREPVPNQEKMIQGQQEDIDLLIAFDHDDTTSVILIEAKGATGWKNGQLRSKAGRLRAIFGSDGLRWNHVKPAFFVMSPISPNVMSPSSLKGIDTSDWPTWMKCGNHDPKWIPLQMPLYPSQFARVIRCSQGGERTRSGDHFVIDHPESRA